MSTKKDKPLLDSIEYEHNSSDEDEEMLSKNPNTSQHSSTELRTQSPTLLNIEDPVIFLTYSF